jgi:hypothetical protein
VETAVTSAWNDADLPVDMFTDATPRSQTFEGFFDWMAHSQAFVIPLKAPTNWVELRAK